ncbi:MAG: methylenetetrahydrofolate reductase [Actinomycetota bacterium]|nr:methylenetetrahydrofolate reductase [Actinomycetota bacterium]
MGDRFEVVCEVEPAIRADLTRARHQVGVLAPVSDGFLIPDNHLGRATVSSIAVAHEVASMGVRAIACLNSRDRNRLGFQRDLLTAAAYGVDELLCVFGDHPSSGGRSNDLTVRSMLEEVREFGTSPAFRGTGRFSVGVTSRLSPIPSWKQAADFLFVQASFDADALVRWRESVNFSGRVYTGVLVVASSDMARALEATTSQIRVPPELLERLESQPDAGIDHACEMLERVRASGAFDGAHLVPVGRYREVARRLELAGWSRKTESRK